MNSSLKLAVIILSFLLFPSRSDAQGCLTGTMADSAFVTGFDLTAPGFDDWAIWGIGTNTNLSPDTRKTGGTAISDLTVADNGFPLRGHGQFLANHTFNFSDGTPIMNGTNVFCGLQVNNPTEDGLGLSFEFTVPASTIEREVVIYTAHHNGAMEFTASLSDGSADDLSFLATELGSNVPAIFTLNYRSETEDGLLTVKIEMVSNAGTSVNPQLYAVTLEDKELSVSGPASVCLNETATYTIPDYDPERTYNVVVSQDSANRSQVGARFPEFDVTWTRGTSAEVCIESESPCSVQTECIDVTIAPLAEVAVTGDTIICDEETYTYVLDPPLGPDEFWEFAVSEGSVIDQTTNSVTLAWDVDNAPGGELCVGREGAACGALINCIDVIFAAPFTPTVEVADQSGNLLTGAVTGGTQVVLTVTNVPDSLNANVQWMGNYEPTTGSGESITVNTPASGPGLSYVATVTSAAGCEESVAINLELEASTFMIPELISPNGDGVNDVFRVYNSGNLTDYTLRIFNRWGQVVFDSTNPDEAWDGTIDDEPQNTDTYLYVTKFRLNSVLVEEDGQFILIR